MADRWEDVGAIAVGRARVGVDGGPLAPGTGQLTVRLDRSGGQVQTSLCAAVPTGVATVQAEMTPAAAWRVAQLLVEAVASVASGNVEAELAADLDTAAADLWVVGDLLVPLAERARSSDGTIVAFPRRDAGR